ncbi:pentatricopeptide repeat-containing protein At5g27110, partial [Carica papaya]|uniref:pentatricopeptide repeat-containing protein At5g27110 n=1 Tax=Carica papaya TaxID=3649 RepID=UPI000B8CEB97
MDTRKLLYLLRRSTSLKLLIQGKLIHQKILSLGLQENGVFSKNLINLYLSCRQLNSANLVFDAIKDPLDVSLWNSLLAGYTKNSMFVEALELFERLWKHPGVTPDFYTYPSVLKACGGLGRVGLGKMIHTHLVKNGVGFDVVVASSLVGMYGKCGVFMNALQVFDEMSERDVACWNTVISCYYQSGKVKEALDIFEKMRVSGFVPNSMTITTAISACARLFDLQRGEEIYMEFVKEGFVLYDDHVRSALLDLYGKCGCLEMGKVVFKQITRKNLVAWNSMIAGYGLKGDSKSCIELLKRMNNEGTKPSLTTLTSILMACSRSSQVRHGKFIHGYIIRNRVETDTFINISLIDFYFKCGRVQAAVHIFKKTPKMDAISWNVTISGYVTMGNYFEALGIYNDMREAGVRPDAITFSSVLSACSQLAALEKGKEIHSSVIESELENDEVVMGALLDMYAKCGDVNKALQTFYKLPERDAVSWTTMIAAYGSHGQALEALTLFRDMLKSNSKPDRITFLAVLSACSHGGLVDEGS